MKASEILQQYQNGQRNFQRLNLRGLNFTGKDLSGADFSHCQIQGANFKQANLTGANFTEAEAGLQKSWVIGLLLVVLVLITVFGYYSALMGYFVALIFDSGIVYEKVVGWMILITLIIFCAVTHRQNLGVGMVTLALAFALAKVPAGALAGVFTVAGASVLGGVFAFAGVFVLAGARALALAGVFVLAGVGVGAVAVAVAGAGATAFAFAFAVATAFDGAFAVATAFAVTVTFTVALALALFACFIGYRTLKDETRDPWLRNFVIAFAAIGGTSFYEANLTDANFTGATLKNTNFNQAILTRTCFKNTVKLNLARAGNTILSNPKVRDLLINPSNGGGIDLYKADLRGANLESANLEKANLKQADISEATLQYANLKEANLTEVNAISTNLSHVLLTGACLEAWNIDSNTNLENVECDYIFLLEKPKHKGSRERRPHDPDTLFKEGDFTRLCQKALNQTIEEKGKDASVTVINVSNSQFGGGFAGRDYDGKVENIINQLSESKDKNEIKQLLQQLIDKLEQDNKKSS